MLLMIKKQEKDQPMMDKYVDGRKGLCLKRV